MSTLERSPHSELKNLPSLNTGGSVAKLLLQHPNEYKVRAVTRNPDSDASRKLAELGAEVVRGDLTDASTLDTAFQGCWGAFVVTNFYDAVSALRAWPGVSLFEAIASPTVPSGTSELELEPD